MFQGPAMFHHFHLTLLLRIMKMVGQCIQYILVPAISGASIVTSSLSLSVSQLLNEQCKQVTCHAVQIQVLYLSDSDEQSCRMAVIFCKLK